jgi:hypothetical protein
LKLPAIFHHARKSVSYVIEKHKKGLLLGVLLLILVVGIATAAVYNYMNMQSTIGVEFRLILFL